MRGTMREHQGFALVATLLIGMVILLLVLGAAVTGIIDRTVTSNQHRANAAYYIAKAGLAEYKTNIYWNLVDYYNKYQTGWCQPPIAGGIKDKSGTVILPLSTWSPKQSFGGGSYRVRVDLSDGYMVVTSEGYYGDGKSTLQLVATAGGGPATAWDNAIFAEGQSATANAINGNVSIYGSVHIVNGALQVDNSGFSTSGTAGVYNDYFGTGTANSDIQSTLVPIVGSSYAYNADLCARLKVASGSVFLQGSSALGYTGHPLYSVNLGNGNVYNSQPNQPKNEITDWHTSGGLVTLQYPTSAGINSGYQGYNLGFPTLATNFPADVGYNANSSSNSNCAWLQQNGTYTLPPADPASSHSGCTDGKGNSISWVTDSSSAGGHLVIRGTIDLDAEQLVINGNVSYSGQGAIRVGTASNDASAAITMDGGALTPADPGGYPNTDFLSFVTPGNISVTNLHGEATAFSAYAGQTFTVDKQAIVVGSIVAKSFDMGTNVPKIAYQTGIRNVANSLCLPGTPCASNNSSNPGIMSNISIERR